MIELQIRNFRRIKSADIILDRIALVQGPNRAGKSSILWAVRGALTGQAIPDAGTLPEGWRKADLQDVVQGDGPCIANVRGQTPDGKEYSATMAWPSGEHRTIGQAPTTSLTAAGLFHESLGKMSIKDRGHALHNLLRPKATEQDFKIAIAVGEEAMAKIMDVVKTAGWDEAQKRSEGKLSELKGKWSQITGENFGSVKYEDWRPAGWDEKLEALTPESAAALVAAAEQLEHEMVAGGAVAADRLAQVTSLAATAVDRVLAYENALQEEFDASEKLKLAQANRKALPPANDEDAMACPHCGEPIVVVAGKLVKSELKALGPVELKKRRADIASWEGKVSNLDNAHRSAVRKTELAKSDADQAEKAKVELEAMKDKQGDPEAIAKAQAMVVLARQKQALVAKVASAKRFSASIKASLSIVAALKPEGIRATILARSLASFNERLKAISEMWMQTVKIDDRFNLWIGKQLFRNESGSEQHRAQVTLQVACAELDGSPMVIIDSDVDWDRVFYGGLCKMLLARKMPGLISYRVNKIEDCFNTLDENKNAPPALKAFVRCYFIDDKGVCTQLPAVEKRAA